MAINQNAGKHAVIWNIESQRSIYSTCVSGPGEVSHSIALANELNIHFQYSVLIEVEFSRAALLQVFGVSLSQWREVAASSHISNSILFTLPMRLHQVKPSPRSRYGTGS